MMSRGPRSPRSRSAPGRRDEAMQCSGTTQRAAANFHARLLSHEASSSEAVLDPDVDVQRQAACLLLASKVHEEPLRLRDMVNSVHHLRGEGVLSDSRQYWEQKEALVREEQLVLRALSFDTSTGQPPSALLLAYLSVMRAARPLCELSCALLNDSAGQPSLSHLASSPNVLAASVIHLASSLLRTPIQARADMHTYMHACTHARMHACTSTSRVAASSRRRGGGWRSTSRRLTWSPPATSCSTCTPHSRAKRVQDLRRRKAPPRMRVLRGSPRSLQPIVHLVLLRVVQKCNSYWR